MVTNGRPPENSDRYSSKLPGLSHLEEAALSIDRRSATLRRALKQVVNAVPAAGTALIRPRTDGTVSWQVEYVGTRRAEMQRWLSARLDGSLEVAAQALQEKSPYLPDTTPVLLRLHPQTPSWSGLWVLWLYIDLTPTDDEELSSFRRNLEALLEVECKEQLYFRGANTSLDSELRESIANGDCQGLPALLTVARMVTGADLTYWGNVNCDLVQVEWHLGAKRPGFGFELPVGQGVGGRAFDRQEIFQIPDYLNCQYRYPSVSDACDKEEIRSVLAVPIRSSSSNTGAVLYATRRTVAPFSISDRLLLLRLARSVGSVPNGSLASHYSFLSRDESLTKKRSELRQILLHSNDVRDVESWLDGFIKGPAILVDGEGRPYVLNDIDRFERVQRLSSSHKTDSRIISLRRSGVDRRGHLYVWPSISLSPVGWPDFLDDVVTTCNIVIDRMEQVYERLNYQRSRWLKGVIEETTPHSRREGYRLGLPIDQGIVWAVAWTRETIQDTEQIRLKSLLEDIALNLMGSPLIFLDDDVGVFLLGRPSCKEPSAVRNELLKVFGPAPLWLVYGTTYDSFDALKRSLLQATMAVKSARSEENQNYVLEANSMGLDSKLSNPILSDKLDMFAKNLFKPLLAHDSGTGSPLTETLTLVLTLGSVVEAAKRLYVHPNTVRYRVRRAEQILNRTLDSPTDRTALNVAAFVWSRRYANSSGETEPEAT